MKRPNINLNNLISNSHINTILPVYLAQNIDPQYIHERLTTPDNDFIDLDWVNKDVDDQPTLVLFHGTEGNAKSHYSKRIMYYLEQIGWRGVVVHFRGCGYRSSEEINLKFYHAGDTDDMKWVLKEIKLRTSKELFAAGVSLGGNALLKYLGEVKNNVLDAAIAVSVPFDLSICIEALDNNIFNKHIYVKFFLSTLLPKMKEYAKQFGNFTDTDRKIDTLDEFNSLYVCKLFDFKDNYDYYTQASCRSYLKDIKTPTLIIQAKNDPMIPISAWPTKDELSSSIKFIATENGGHAGFVKVSKDYKKSLLRLPKFMIEYLKIYSRKPRNDSLSNKLSLVKG